MQMRLSALLALPCAFVLSGCANTHLSQHPGLTSSRIPSAQPASSTPTVSVILYSRKLRFDAPVATYVSPHWSKHATEGKLNKVLKEFPSFVVAHPGVVTPYRLVVEATHNNQGNKKVSVLCGMTKYIIPCTEEHQVIMDAILTREGQAPKSYEATGSYRVRKHLLWLLMPLKWHRGVPGETTLDAFRDILIQAERDVVP